MIEATRKVTITTIIKTVVMVTTISLDEVIVKLR